MPEQPDVTALEVYEATLEYASDLFTASPKELFSRADVLVILNLMRDDPLAQAMLKTKVVKL